MNIRGLETGGCSLVRAHSSEIVFFKLSLLTHMAHTQLPQFKVQVSDRGQRIKSPGRRLCGAEGADIPQSSFTFSRIKPILPSVSVFVHNAGSLSFFPQSNLFSSPPFFSFLYILHYSVKLALFVLFLRNFHTHSYLGSKRFHSLTNRRLSLVPEFTLLAEGILVLCKQLLLYLRAVFSYGMFLNAFADAFVSLQCQLKVNRQIEGYSVGYF